MMGMGNTGSFVPLTCIVWLAMATALAAPGSAIASPLLQKVEDATPELSADIAMSRRAYDYGNYFWKSGDVQRALQAFDLAIRLDPKFSLA